MFMMQTCWGASSLCQKSHTNQFAGESACATYVHQQFAGQVGQAFQPARTSDTGC
jgi:hypothetical protein